MGKKSRRDRAAYGPLRPPGSQTTRGSRRGPTPGRFDNDVQSQPARNEPSDQPKLTVAEAEAECRAAMAAIPPSYDKSAVKISQHPRILRAIVALTKAVTLDEDDQRNLTSYLGCGGFSMEAGGNMGSKELIKIMKRWPRIRKYWPRLRRRICSGCGKQYDLSEPRLWVCGGCGEARYCDESCQRAHWSAHQFPCLKAFYANARERHSQGESIGRMREEYLAWYPVSQRKKG